MAHGPNIFFVGAALLSAGADQVSGQRVGAAAKTHWGTSGAANTWIPYWLKSRLSHKKNKQKKIY